MKITPKPNYLVLKEFTLYRDDPFEPPINDDWMFEVVADGKDHYMPGDKVIVKELTVKTDNYIITHHSNVVGVVS